MKASTKLFRWRKSRAMSEFQASRIFRTYREQYVAWERGCPVPAFIFVVIDAIEKSGFSLQPIHYVYKLTDLTTGQFYFGSRTCRVDPLKDSYTGYGVWRHRIADPQLHKEIIGIYPTQGEAIKAECKLFMPHKDNPLCVNGIPGQGWIRKKNAR